MLFSSHFIGSKNNPKKAKGYGGGLCSFCKQHGRRMTIYLGLELLFYVIVMKLLIWGRCIMSELRAALKACTACRVNAQISTLCTIFHFAQEKKVQLLTYPRLDACPEHLRSRKSNIKQNHSFYPPPAHCTEDNH